MSEIVDDYSQRLEWLRNFCIPSWTDAQGAYGRCVEILKGVGGDPRLLKHLFDQAISLNETRLVAERFENVVQIVLLDALDRGFRLRLQIYQQSQPDWPHNHRWPLSSLLLRGRIWQSVYDWRLENVSRTDLSSLWPRHFTERQQGDLYFLHEDVVDCVFATEGAVALLVRGPATRKFFTIFDRGTNRRWNRFGAQDERDQDKANRQLSTTELLQLRGYLEEQGLIDADASIQDLK